MLSRFVTVLRRITIGGTAGAIAGIVVAGLGGRAVMTIAAVINPQATGRLTENGELIGAFTMNGTLALLLFGGLFSGLAAGVVWVVVSPWIPWDGWRRTLAAAAAAVALGGPLLVRSENRDFVILDHDAVLLVLLVGLVALVGLSIGWLDARLDRSLPRPEDRPSLGAAYFAISLLGGILMLPLVVGFYLSRDVCGCADPPTLVGWALVAAGLATLAGWVIRIRTGRAGEPRPLQAAGRLAVLAAIGLGAARLAGELTRILDAA